jgi:hypothetical protein
MRLVEHLTWSFDADYAVNAARFDGHAKMQTQKQEFSVMVRRPRVFGVERKCSELKALTAQAQETIIAQSLRLRISAVGPVILLLTRTHPA